MKFQVDRQSFHKAINTVESIIPAREIRSIISNILIEAEGNRITLTATDLEIGIKTSIEVEPGRAGSLTLPAKKLSQAVREFRGSTISFEADDSNHIVLQDASGKSRARIMLMGTPSDEYPVIPTLPESNYTKIPVAVCQEMIRKTSYAMAEEDARYVFNGLYIKNDGKTVTFVSTDGRRLSRIKREFPEKLPLSGGVIIPNKAVRELQKLLDSDQEGKLAFEERDRRVYLRIGAVDLISKLIDGQFPDYEQVIPAKVSHEVAVERQTIENSLRQVSVMAAEPSRQVRLTFASDGLSIAAQTPDIGEAQDTFEIDYSGEEVTIAFNSNYLMDVIKVVSSQDLRVGFSSGSAPAIVKDPEDMDFIAVIMPMKL
ncbi:MAG: DNA polymerase III subunit beta [Spirochaetales bacterium]|nr:DNA polymerase III subunit beta [Spirochaetales bacterium]MCP5484628.1 DNA polymerase III subunit beta [Spirochaetales bacterium]